jgi:hypothetical protein
MITMSKLPQIEPFYLFASLFFIKSYGLYLDLKPARDSAVISMITIYDEPTNAINLQNY